MLSRDTHQQAIVEDGVVGLVLQDFERDFDAAQTMQIGALHIVITPKLMLTGRYHSIRSADVVKQRIAQGIDVCDGAAALGLVIGAMADGLSQLVRAVAVDIQTAEDEFLNEHLSPATRDLMAIRRRAARLHRMIGGMRAALHRLEMDPDLPALFAPVAEHHVQRLHALDADVAATQAQLRMLRDELDLQTAQRTNQNLYVLSVMSALLLPATLVTGFFGMNTGGLPFAHMIGGTAVAACSRSPPRGRPGCCSRCAARSRRPCPRPAPIPKDGWIVRAFAFFDAHAFDDFWTRASPVQN